ncbi:hypothetical protein Lser_V15G36698 [Lactuca serriola]
MPKKIGISVIVKRLQKRVFARNMDVKEGHFAVIAVDEHEERRFVVPVAYLERASFVRLLERAAEEFGFNYEGAVVIPCRPSELQRLLAEQSAEEMTC